MQWIVTPAFEPDSHNSGTPKATDFYTLLIKAMNRLQGMQIWQPETEANLAEIPCVAAM
jgi:hypothetical protein